MFHVDFANKNTQRRYPIAASASLLADDRVTIPDTLIAGAKLTSIYGSHEIYISRVYVKEDYVNIFLVYKVGESYAYYGYAEATLSSDFTTVAVTPLVGYAAGFIVFGLKDCLTGIQGIHNLTYAESRLEDSVITCIPSPSITGIKIGSNVYTGRLAFTGANVNVTASGSQVGFTVVNKESIRANNDLSAMLNNCPTNSITSINGVTPDENGNIDIYGIDPVRINFNAPNSTLRIVALNWSFDTICGYTKQIPPLNKTNQYGGILNKTLEEWRGWNI